MGRNWCTHKILAGGCVWALIQISNMYFWCDVAAYTFFDGLSLYFSGALVVNNDLNGTKQKKIEKNI